MKVMAISLLLLLIPFCSAAAVLYGNSQLDLQEQDTQMSEKIMLNNVIEGKESYRTPYGVLVFNFQLIFGLFCLIIALFVLWKVL